MCNTWLLQSQNRWNLFFLFSILLTMTFRELVIMFPSLSWHHTDIAFINQHSHKTDNQYICPQYLFFIFIHLHYFICVTTQRFQGQSHWIFFFTLHHIDIFINSHSCSNLVSSRVHTRVSNNKLHN